MAISLASFSQEVTENALEPIQTFIKADYAVADLLKNIKKQDQAVVAVLNNKNQSFLSMTDSIQVEMVKQEVKSVKIYASTRMYNSANEFFVINDPKNKKKKAIDLTAKMDIKAKTKIIEEDETDQKQLIAGVVATKNKTGYLLILNRNNTK